MKFEKLTNELYGARKAGYVIDADAPIGWDRKLERELIISCGNQYVYNKVDAMYDNDGDLYKGEDGNLYAVQYVYIDGEYKPLCWQRMVMDIGE